MIWSIKPVFYLQHPFIKEILLNISTSNFCASRLSSSSSNPFLIWKESFSTKLQIWSLWSILLHCFNILLTTTNYWPKLHNEVDKETGNLNTCTRFGLRTSNLALVLKEVVANGPENWTEFSTVKFSESIVWDISSTFTIGRVPLDNNGNRPTKEVYLWSQ